MFCLCRYTSKCCFGGIQLRTRCKGNTATNATKPAKLETGAEINVPLFINEGDKIKVDTEKGVYIERIKE